MDQSQFERLVHQLREGYAAERALVELFEREIKRVCHIQLRENHLTRLIEPEDICQSVFRTFFRRLRKGSIRLESAEKLQALLLTIARNRIAALGRHENIVRMLPISPDELSEQTDSRPSQTASVEALDLSEQVRRHLTLEERELLDLRLDGFTWEEISAQIGGKAEARRKQFSRVLRMLQLLPLMDKPGSESSSSGN